MAESKKDKSKRPSAKASAASPLREHEELSLAVEGFIRANTNFESSIPVNTALEILNAQTSLQDVFTTVLQRQLLNLDGALRWALFLSLAPARAEEEGDQPFSPAAPFSATAALALIASVYDMGVAEVVSAHFEYDSDSDSEEESAEEAPQ